jgi:rhodanese-related sulfurtransferase
MMFYIVIEHKRIQLIRSWMRFACVLMLASTACAQSSNKQYRLGHCDNSKFDREVAKWLSFTVPAYDVDSLRKHPEYVVLDARESSEYKVSHIAGAIHCGYDDFDKSVLDSLDKTQPVLVYCSIGFRSEKIAERLQKAGFKRVYNLYGSIFEWTNRGYPLVDEHGQPTQRIHTYNQMWGRWVKLATAIKVTKYTPARG